MAKIWEYIIVLFFPTALAYYFNLPTMLLTEIEELFIYYDTMLLATSIWIVQNNIYENDILLLNYMYTNYQLVNWLK